VTLSGRWRSLLSHLRKFMTVGLGCALLDLAVLMTLTSSFGWVPHAANLVSRPCGGLFGFVFNKIWTFNLPQARGTGKQFAKYWTTWLAAYAMSELFIWLLYRFAGWPAFPAKVAAEALVFATNFLAMRYWTFRQPRRP
jgi:putative flippase GtrA